MRHGAPQDGMSRGKTKTGIGGTLVPSTVAGCHRRFYETDEYNHEEIFLLDVRGEKLAQVGHVEYVPPQRWFRKNPKLTWRYDKHDTIEKALDRMKAKAANVNFILSLDVVLDKEWWRVATIYKTPKGFTIQAWLNELMRREQTAIQQEVKEIDAEANQPAS